MLKAAPIHIHIRITQNKIEPVSVSARTDGLSKDAGDSSIQNKELQKIAISMESSRRSQTLRE